MNADALTRLCRIASGAHAVTDTPAVTSGKPGITPVSPVTPPWRQDGNERGEAEADLLDKADVAERAGMAFESVPAVYLDVWTRLNCQKPAHVTEAEWRLALDDGGLFLDAWGKEAATLGWTPGALFDVANGLVWRLKGKRVVGLGRIFAKLNDGRFEWADVRRI